MAGILYVVATPIGNLGDMTHRAINVLAEVDVIASEDTRVTRRLLSHFEIKNRCISYHDKNEIYRAGELVNSLCEGDSIALVSDAGTPCISDPGYRIVNLAKQSGIEVVSVPGPSAVTAALSIPLYQTGSVAARVREAKQLASRAHRLIDNARRSAAQDATSAWETLIAAQARIVALDSQVRAALIALDGVTQESTVGSRTVLDVLDAEQELLNAQVSLVSAQRDEVVGYYDLLVAVGGLTARDLALPVDPYDEKEYYSTIRNKWWGLDISAEE